MAQLTAEADAAAMLGYSGNGDRSAFGQVHHSGSVARAELIITAAALVWWVMVVRAGATY